MKGGGESRRIVGRSKIAIIIIIIIVITFDPIPVYSLTKSKTRPANGTNGPVNGETMVDGIKRRRPR